MKALTYFIKYDRIELSNKTGGDIMSNYTVYMHVCPNGKRYIGITRQSVEKRWKNGKGYSRKENTYFYKAILKYGWNNIQHQILFEGLTKKEAEDKEIELISFYKSSDRESGYNIMNGGNCSESMPDEIRQKLRESHFGSKSVAAKSLYQCDLSGNIIKKWNCTMDVQRELGYTNALISRCCKGKRPTAYGYKWSYISDYNKNSLCNNYNPLPTKKILQYTKNGNYLKEYESSLLAEVGNCLPKNARQAIRTCCNGKLKTAYGYIWKYAEQ